MLWLLLALIAIALLSGALIVAFLVSQLDMDAAALVRAKARGAIKYEGEAVGEAALSPSRWDAAADVPTARELGFEVVEGSMRGIAAPAGVPRPVLDRLAEAVRRAVEDPEFHQVAVQQSLPLRYLGPDAYRAELLALRAQYERLWGEHPWKE